MAERRRSAGSKASHSRAKMLPKIVLLIVAASSFPRSSVSRVAYSPPRGWNSYDSYTWKVSEEQFLANCAAVAKDLKPFGYEYCVVDYLWFQDLDGAGKLIKDPITKLHVDANGRLQPALDRWPSTKDGVGFKPIADKVHALGMKFGIHVMRGISTAAVAAKLPILGTNATAADIGLEDQLCPWWKGVMAVDLTHPAGQSYYDSIYEQYADWGVDFIKNDCVFGNQFMPEQIKAQSKSILKTQRDIVYSLSPGSGMSATMDKAKEINSVVNMYRVTGDDWDSWKALQGHFGVAAWAANQSLIGAAGLRGRSWPDLDMLPLGVITSPNSGKGPYKNTSLTADQQRTQMTLWAIAKSPLMFGGDATQLDAFTLGLLTNKELLSLNSASFNNNQVQAGGSTVVWVARSMEGSRTYVALFNTGTASATVSVTLEALGISGCKKCSVVKDLWSGASGPAVTTGVVQAEVKSDGVVLLSLAGCAP